MKLSMAAELGIRGILVLAQDYGRGPVSLKEICRRRDLPRQYLSTIFAALARADLVGSVRGQSGGRILAKPPEEITLLEVIEAIEGPLATNLCQHTPPRCEEVDCPVRPVWAEIQEKIRAALASKHLSDFI